ncbi:rod shape-determining protein MreC [Nonomuraea wenchangensis]|uniref:Cell shape-determining protein MreC n=1 Tax=Nonomuraea wenchangensis TaxID=568860 RepID=A0A1I0LU56_9ACTN|nr:rod shape-determining protein MreC [Nonomuraea wenchangensis]SEU45730.1 rod shape-determining protein MreC [Nonomuraea wenchangensis]
MRDSRRARLILGVLLTAALVILTVDHRTGESSPLRPLRAVGAWVFGSAEQLGGGVVRPVTTFVQALFTAPAAQERIRVLTEENARLRTGMLADKLDAARSSELKKLLGLAGAGGYKIVTGNVVARRGQPGFEDTVQIDIGSADGVQPEMTVLNGDGLVGRVIHASTTSSTVLLISDPASAAGARLEGGREIGVVHGVGEHGRLVQFRLLDSAAPLVRGGRIVSFGSQNGRPYVPGVPVGVIERVESTPGELTRIAYARPFADLTALDAVGVVVEAPKRDPRDAVLPGKEGDAVKRTPTRRGGSP